MNSQLVLLFFLLMLQACRKPDAANVAAESANPVLLRVTFEEYQPGESYGLLDVNRDFGTLQSLGTFFPGTRITVVARQDGRGNAIAVFYPKGKVRSFNSGASWFFSDVGKHRELYLSYWIKFPADFQFRAGGKLHGLCGGDCNTGGHKPNGHDGWSSRVHWGPNGQIMQYVYHKDQPGKYGQVFVWQQPGTRLLKRTIHENETLKPLLFTRGEWQHIETFVRVNDIGQKNGEVRSWYNGKLALDVSGFEFRDASCKKDELLIDRMYFSTFFGGNSDRYRPQKDEVIYFDDFMVSTEFIPTSQSR